MGVVFWASPEELRWNWNDSVRWTPQCSDAQRVDGYAGWRKAVERTLGWVDLD